MHAISAMQSATRMADLFPIGSFLFARCSMLIAIRGICSQRRARPVTAWPSFSDAFPSCRFWFTHVASWIVGNSCPGFRQR